MTDENGQELDHAQREVPPIRYASCGELRIYPVDERELDDLARGSAAPLELNLAIAFLSVSATLSATLLTTPLSDRLFYCFFIIVVATLIAGVVLVFRCVRGHRSSKKLLNEIKARMSPKAGIQEPLTGGTESPGASPR